MAGGKVVRLALLISAVVIGAWAELAQAQTITVDPTTPQGIFDAVVWQTLGCFTAGNIVGLFIKITNRS